MDIGAFLLLLALFIPLAIYLAQPFTKKRRPRALPKEDHTRSALMAERDRLLDALQELDFDYTLGKVPEDEYPALRATLLKQGAEILKKLDAIGEPSEGGDAESRIEAAISARRAEIQETAAEENADDDIESLIAARRRARKDKSGGFCPNCGHPVLQSDKFCPHCGHPLR
jgi:rubrerythrin